MTTLVPKAAVSVPSALLVLPAPPGKGLPSDTVIAGLPLLRRIVLAATLLAALFGVGLGAASAYGDSGVTGLALRFVEFVGAVPGLILIGILRLADPSGGVLGVLMTLTLLRTLEVAQLVRGHVLAVLPSDFVEASRAFGASRRWRERRLWHLSSSPVSSRLWRRTRTAPPPGPGRPDR